MASQTIASPPDGRMIHEIPSELDFCMLLLLLLLHRAAGLAGWLALAFAAAAGSMHKQLGRSHQAAASADLPSAFTEPYTVLRLAVGGHVYTHTHTHTHTHGMMNDGHVFGVAQTHKTTRKAKQKKSNRNQFSNRTRTAAYREGLLLLVAVCDVVL
jgi:hypothetical protein